MRLPEDHRPYIDKYFLRAKEVIQAEHYNPRIKAQVFIRQGDANVYGIGEAIDIIEKYGKVERLYAMDDGQHFESCEPIMVFLVIVL